jgi:hypothetical protein
VEGPDLVARLRQALDGAPNAKRFFLIPPPLAGEGQGGGLGLNFPPPLPGEGSGPPAHASRAERAMRAFEALGGGLVLVSAVPISDTCKEVVDGLVRRTVPRDTLVDARGPWMFDRGELVRALDAVSTADVTNLVDLCRAAHLRVRVLIQS